jgi:hypothetical protein
MTRKRKNYQEGINQQQTPRGRRNVLFELPNNIQDEGTKLVQATT